MRRTLALAAVALVAAACGSASQAALESPSPSPAAASQSPSAATGLTFPIKGIKTSASGTMTLIPGAGRFMLELRITGLAANSEHISHIHVGSCEQPGPIKIPLNQVVADGTGAADVRTDVTAIYPPASGHWYVVVHSGPNMQGTNATYLLCGDLF